MRNISNDDRRATRDADFDFISGNVSYTVVQLEG